MNYKRSKYFTKLSKRKIKYLFIKKNSQITVVFFHGLMSDMIGKKPNAVQKFCRKLKLNFLKFLLIDILKCHRNILQILTTITSFKSYEFF